VVPTPVPPRELAEPDNLSDQRNAPNRLRPRPAFRLTTAEATATRRAINLRRSVLGASATLGIANSTVNHPTDENGRKLRQSLRDRVSVGDVVDAVGGVTSGIRRGRQQDRDDRGRDDEEGRRRGIR
jgi:hypothetical protein